MNFYYQGTLLKDCSVIPQPTLFEKNGSPYWTDGNGNICLYRWEDSLAVIRLEDSEFIKLIDNKKLLTLFGIYTEDTDVKKCPNCKRAEPLTKHHVIPQSKGGINNESNYLWICGSCHVKLHSLYTRKYLKTTANTKEIILNDELMIAFGKLIKNKKGFIRSKQRKNRP